jgi:hypothetical protein
MVEHLPGKCKALNSNSSTAEKKKIVADLGAFKMVVESKFSSCNCAFESQKETKEKLHSEERERVMGTKRQQQGS